jgi:threonine dehydrogenase-like Zn-dependent dehydrogenase
VFPLLTCGACYACLNGFGHVCATLRVIGFDCDGGMAEYAVFPVENLLGLPEEMSWATGALIEPLAVCLHAQSRRPVAPTERVVVLGAGPIGLLTALSLRARGVTRLVISDVSPERLAIAAAAGVPAADPSREDLAAHVREMTDGDGADVLFEAAGVQATASQMTDLVRPHGTIVNLSVFKEQPVVDLRTVNFKELSIVGSRVYTRQDFRDAIALAPDLPVERIVSHRLPLSEVAQGFELLSRGGGASKVLFFPDVESL